MWVAFPRTHLWMPVPVQCMQSKLCQDMTAGDSLLLPGFVSAAACDKGSAASADRDEASPIAVPAAACDEGCARMRRL